MATAIDVRELPARLDEALAVVSAGGEVILLDGSTPRARLVPLDPVPARAAGLHPGAIQPDPDFDAPLPDDFWAAHSGRPDEEFRQAAAYVLEKNAELYRRLA